MRFLFSFQPFAATLVFITTALFFLQNRENTALAQSTNADEVLCSGFETPPPGFGEVPFWWWTGEKLDTERLIWQVDELARKGISGVQVNYAHQDVRDETHPNWLTYPNDPEIFTDEWFEIFEKVAARCREHQMGIGLSGYTLDWQNSPTNLFDRLIYREKELQSRTLYVAAKRRASELKKIATETSTEISPEIAASFESNPDDELVRIVAYPVDAAGKIDAEHFEIIATPGTTEAIKTNAENFVESLTTLPSFQTSSPSDSNPIDFEIWFFKAKRVPQTLNPLCRDAGKTVVERFFQPFEDRAKTAQKNSKPPQKQDGPNAQTTQENVPETFGLNYFFQDELQIGTGDLTWTDDLPDEFEARKGYSYWTAAPAEFDADAGPKTEKYRLDYMDVRVRLAEERYFQPIFNWNASRGRIYACDSGGRGKDPSEFGDYFSAVRWYTAPGHDTPGGNADFIKNKVSSSIAHFYERPRVWLEGYHSFGWGATPERLLFATNENFLFGANLLNLHGLYYSTYGGFWEWAPPCYHFRQPYWETFDAFLKYFERLSFALTRGVERADVVVLYPVSSFQSRLGGARARDVAFGAAEKIFETGRDVLFIDDDSIARAEIRDGKLAVAGAEHSVLVLPATRGIRWATLKKALEFYRAGGTVVALDSLPETSDKAGRDDPELTAAVREIFGLTATELADKLAINLGENAADKTVERSVSIVRNDNGGVGAFLSGAPEKSKFETTATENADSLLLSNGAVSKIREYRGGFAGRWAWSAEPRRAVFFKWIATGLSDEPTEYSARFFCDNSGALYVGERKICDNIDYSNGWNDKITLKNGDVVTLDGTDADEPRVGSAGAFFALVRDERTVASIGDFRISRDGPTENANWRTNADADAFSKLEPVDFANVHILHRTGVNSEAQGAQTAQNAQTNDNALLWKRLETFANKFPRDLWTEAPVKTGANPVYLHRSTPEADLFFIMRAEKGSWLTFQAKGKPEFWNAWDGSRREIVESFQTNGETNGVKTDNTNKSAGETTTLRWPFEPNEAGLVVFWKNETPTIPLTALETNVSEISKLGPDANANDAVWKARCFANNNEFGQKFIRLTTADGTTKTLEGTVPEPIAPLRLDGDWSFELVPTLDNRFGDFRLPISDTKIGAEAQRFDRVAVVPNASENGKKNSHSEQTSQIAPIPVEIPAFDNAQNVLCDFGQKFWKLGPFPSDVDVDALDARLAALRTVDPNEPIEIEGREFRWTPYSFSWRWGIEGNPGRQGYHGLKEKIDSRFIGLGKNGSALNETTFVPEETGSIYYLWTTAPVAFAPQYSDENSDEKIKVNTPSAVPVDVVVGGDAPNALFVAGRRVRFADENISLIAANLAKSAKNTNISVSSPILLRYDAAGRRSFAFVARNPNGRSAANSAISATSRLIIENGSDDGAANDDRKNRLAAAAGERTPLSISWFDRPGVLDFDVFGTSAQRPTYWFRFVAPPGWTGADVPIRGKLRSIVVDGKRVDVQRFATVLSGNDFWRGRRSQTEISAPQKTDKHNETDDFSAFSVRPIRLETFDFETPFERAATVLFEIVPEPGVCDGAVFPEPIRLRVAQGTTELGDWNGRGVLANYSGAAKYGKTFIWKDQKDDGTEQDGKNKANDAKKNARITLDLGAVGASCRVFLNGREVGVLTASPWTLEIGEFLTPGENRLEILVANTLANFYSNLPSNYKGSAPSGLIGPVEIRRNWAFELKETNAAPTR